MGRIVVLGLGNPVLRDDAIGLVVATEVCRLLARAPVPGVDVLTNTRAGFELIELLRGYARAIIVDCLTLPEPTPGRVHRLTLSDVAGSARLVNAHELSAGTAFQLAEQLQIPMPTDVDILAVEGGDTQTFAEGLTPEVEAVVDPLAREIHADLRRRAPEGDVPDGEDFARRRALFGPIGQ